MEPGLRMDSEYSLPMGMIYSSPGADGTESKKLHPSRVFLVGYAGPLTVHVYAFQCSTEEHRSDSLWEIQADGTHPHPLLSGWNNPSQECCGSWTPDGTYFIFQSTRNGKTQIWAIAEKGGLFANQDGNQRS